METTLKQKPYGHIFASETDFTHLKGGGGKEEWMDRLRQMTSVDAHGLCFSVHKFCVDLQ